jgi:hypothetical protein
MEPATSFVRLPASNRVVACLWCHQATTHSDVVRNRGLCPKCARESGELSWRLVYDRDRKIGAIPANLRVEYGL